MAQFSRRTLGSTGLDLPCVGIGCSDMGNRNRVREPSEAFDTVEKSLELGMNWFDVAPYYGLGLAERRLGDALRDRAPTDYVLSTKIGRVLKPDLQSDRSIPRHGFHSAMPFSAEFDYSYSGVMRSWEASLHRLGLARVNILLVHDIGAFAHPSCHQQVWKEFFEGGLRALQELKAAQQIDAFGFGVNEAAVCHQMLDEGDIDCFMIAGRHTLLDQRSVIELLDRCLARQVGVIAAGPYNTGILAGGSKRTGAMRFDYGTASPGSTRTISAA